MKIDSNPLQITDTHYTEPEEVNMVEVTDDFNMIEVTKDFVNEPVMVRVSEYLDQGFVNSFRKLLEMPPMETLMVSIPESMKIPT